MSDRFNTFLSTLPPTLADYFVGYGSVSGTEIEKRWTLTQLATLLESNLNLTAINQGADNHLNVTGSATGTGTVTLSPTGTDPNINLILAPKGTGTVTFTGSLTIAADLNLAGFDLITGGGDVLTGGGAINTANGSLTLGSGSILSTSGNITLTSGNIVLSAGDITLSGTGTLDTNGGALLANTIAVSSGATITCADNLTVGAPAANKVITTATLTGNKDAPAAGNEPPNIVVTNIIDLQDEVFVRDKLYTDSDIMTQTYLRASMDIGLTADIGSAQGNGLIAKEFNQYSVCANIGDAATLPALAPEGYSLAYRYPYLHIIVRNDGANAMDVFPNTGGTIDGGVVDAAVAVAAGTVKHFYGQEAGGVDTWFTA